MIIPNVYGTFETIQCWANIVDDNVAILKRIIVDVPTITTN